MKDLYELCYKIHPFPPRAGIHVNTAWTPEFSGVVVILSMNDTIDIRTIERLKKGQRLRGLATSFCHR